jgi:hypothetical protein
VVCILGQYVIARNIPKYQDMNANLICWAMITAGACGASFVMFGAVAAFVCLAAIGVILLILESS